MKKLLTLIAALTMYNAHGGTNGIIWAAGTATSTSTCESSSNITKPSNPTKDGYRFIGWKAESVPDEVGDFITFLVTDTAQADDSFPVVDNGTTFWKIIWNNRGYLKGIARCSADGVDNSNCLNASGVCTKSENPSTTVWKYCWCKATYIETNSQKHVSLPSSMPWVMTKTNKNSSECTEQCVRYCGAWGKYYPYLRKAMLGAR